MSLTFAQIKSRSAFKLQDTANAYWIAAHTWTATTAYLVGAQVANGTNAYVCTTAGTSAGSGGPTGTTTHIHDGAGTLYWDYVGTTATTELDTYANDGVREWNTQTKGIRGTVTMVANSTYDVTRTFAYWVPPAGITPLMTYGARNAGRPLDRTTEAQEDASRTSWEDWTGTPVRYLLGPYGATSLRTVPFPANDPAAWVTITAYALGAQVVSGSNVYTCITAGTSSVASPPTTTSTDYTDGTVHWTYVSAFTSNTLTSLRVDMAYLPADMLNDTDAISMPFQFQHLLQEYIVGMALARDGEKQDIAAATLAIGRWNAALLAATRNQASGYDQSALEVATERF